MSLYAIPKVCDTRPRATLEPSRVFDVTISCSSLFFFFFSTCSLPMPHSNNSLTFLQLNDIH